MRISCGTNNFRFGADMLDITAPDIVQVQIRNDKKVIWVNVSGVCVLRACRIDKFELTDLSVTEDAPH
jgi:hypothetical protein